MSIGLDTYNCRNNRPQASTLDIFNDNLTMSEKIHSNFLHLSLSLQII